MALTDKLTAIADAIRGKTGKTAEMTLDQMAAEISGMEAGGGAGGIYMAKVTPASDMDSMEIMHNLGTENILLVACWAETLNEVTHAANGTLAKFWAKTDVATQRGGNGFSPGYAWNVTNNYANPQAPNTGSYETLTIIDENSIDLPRGQSGTVSAYLAGVTYTVIVVAASAFAEV